MTDDLWRSESPTLRETIVCYADILGFSDMTRCAFREGKATDFLKRVKEALDQAHDDMRRIANSCGWAPPIFEMKLFTDNFLVAYPIADPAGDRGEPELATVLMLFAEVQTKLALDGFFLRGAIAKGDHYQAGDIVFGDALLEAVGLDKSGGPPRLIIAPSLEPRILEYLSYYSDGDSPHHVWLLEDPCDGKLFLNYLDAVLGDFPDFCDYAPIATHRDQVSEFLCRYESDERIRQKYEWVAGYHNYTCTELAERHPVPTTEWADPEYATAAMWAQGLPNYIVPVESQPSPLPLDAERLRQRLAAR